MPKLGDYLGHLLSEITIARMQADLETIRVAEFYATHALLRRMPVPHMRLVDLELDVPVAIKKMEEPREDESPRGGVAPDVVHKTFDQVVMKRLREDGIQTKAADQKRLRSLLVERIAALTGPSDVAVDVIRVADDLAHVTAQWISKVRLPDGLLDSERVRDFEAELKAAARLALIKVRTPPPRLHVLVTTAELREAGPSEIITRLKLKISEEAVEWTTVESDGREQDRLVPE